MTLLHDEIARTLAGHAGDAPAADGLLAAVRRRNHRHAARRRTAGTLIALAVCGGLAMTAAEIEGEERDTVLATPGPATPGPTTPAPSAPVPATPPSGFLAPIELRPSFPLTPAHLPPGVRAQPRIFLERGASFAQWERLEQGGDGVLAGVSIAVTPQPLGIDPLAMTDEADVDGRPATVIRYEGSVEVRWERTPGEWVAVTAAAPYTSEDALEVARSLRDVPIAHRTDFAFTLAPKGFVLAEHHPGGVTLGPPDGVPNPQDDPRAVVVVMRSVSSETDGNGDPVRFGDRSGWLDDQGGRFDLVLVLDDASRLQITTPSSGGWTRDELARFAGGVTYDGSRAREEG